MADDENRTEFTTIIVDDSKSLRRALEELDVRINASMKEGWDLSGAVTVGITRSAGYDFPLVSQSMTRRVEKTGKRNDAADYIAEQIVAFVQHNLKDSQEDMSRLVHTDDGRRNLLDRICKHWSSR